MLVDWNDIDERSLAGIDLREKFLIVREKTRMVIKPTTVHSYRRGNLLLGMAKT